MAVVFPYSNAVTTKRGVLTELAKIYDPIEFTVPVTLKGKLIHRVICDTKTARDADLSEKLQHEWCK